MFMVHTPPAIRQPNGDLLVPAQTARLLEHVLRGLEEDLRALHGKTIGEPGQIETHKETGHRQQLVDSLSASVGVRSPTVEARQMPEVHSLADSSEPLERLRALAWLLFDGRA
jgi:hypothetical protein